MEEEGVVLSLVWAINLGIWKGTVLPEWNYMTKYNLLQKGIYVFFDCSGPDQISSNMHVWDARLITDTHPIPLKHS